MLIAAKEEKTMMRKSAEQYPNKFFCCGIALLLGIAALVLYVATGVIPGFTDSYSLPVFIACGLAVLCNIIFLCVHVNTLEMIPFVAYLVGAMLFLSANANYLAAVVRKIDVTRVSVSFIATIVLMVAAAVLYAIGFAFVKDGE